MLELSFSSALGIAAAPGSAVFGYCMVKRTYLNESVNELGVK